MPELSPDRRNRWYRVKWPGEPQLKPAWAEKYFDNHTEAFDYAERRRAEHPPAASTGRSTPTNHPAAWAVCVDPV